MLTKCRQVTRISFVRKNVSVKEYCLCSDVSPSRVSLERSGKTCSQPPKPIPKAKQVLQLPQNRRGATMNIDNASNIKIKRAVDEQRSPSYLRRLFSHNSLGSACRRQAGKLSFHGAQLTSRHLNCAFPSIVTPRRYLPFKMRCAM